jgi:hypothetical protein
VGLGGDFPCIVIEIGFQKACLKACYRQAFLDFDRDFDFDFDWVL